MPGVLVRFKCLFDRGSGQGEVSVSLGLQKALPAEEELAEPVM